MGIFTRTSCREFLDKPVEREKLEQIFRASMQAPSAINQQPWEFLVVEDKEILAKFYERGPFARSLKTAPMLIIFYERLDVPRPAFADLDMASATTLALLQIDDLGLGGVWMGVSPVKEKIDMVEEIIGKKEGLKPFSMIALGYPAEKKEQQDRFDKNRISYYTK